MNQKPNALVHLIEVFIEGRWSGILFTMFTMLLVFLVLLLPPISLADRVMSIGYTRIGTDGGSLTNEEGMEVNFLPQGVWQSFRAKLNTIPRDAFLEGSAGAGLTDLAGTSLLDAAESIPPNLFMKSPFYQIEWRGEPANAVLIRVPIPKDVPEIHTLDLYAWNGQNWEWLPNQKLPAEGVIETNLNFTPGSVVVMATHPVNPHVSTNYQSGTALNEHIKGSLVEINPQGLMLGDGGKIEGTLEDLPAEITNSALWVVPTIRNWQDDGTVRSDLIDNMLVDENSRQRQIRAIVDLVQRNAYTGIDLDYKGISPDLRQEYNDFVADLAEALPANKLLSIRVDLPQQVSLENWETGAYDWQTIGRVANVVKIPTSPDPKDYVPGGKMESLLDWAVGQVDRYKIQLILSTLSTEEVNGAIRNVTYQQALEPLGSVAAIDDLNIVNPGQQLDFTLAGLPATTGIQFDQASGAYWFAFLDQNNVQRTIFLENAASIARKLQFVAQYNLRGVTVQNLLREDNDGQIWEVVRKFIDLVIAPVESQYDVVWQVQDENGSVIAEEVVSLNNPNYKWTVPEGGNAYRVAAAIAANQNSADSVPRGGVDIMVATPSPTPSPTLQPTATPEPSATPVPPTPAPPPPVAEAAPAEVPAGPAPVAPAQGNLPFGYGIQADPRGNTPANIGLITGMGFNWVKFQMAWKDVESAPGNYSWGFWDDVIGQYAASGIKVLLSIPKAPDWARPPDDDKSVEGPPQDPALYANFVGQVAGRYRGKVQAIEVWNEQNLYYEAGGHGRINAAAYTELLKQSYNAIKAANPDMIVVSGALTPTGAPPPAALDDVEYLRQMYANGAKGFFDAVGAHPSGFANPPDALFQGGDFDPTRGYDDHRSFFFRNTMEEYRRVMVENGDGDKTIWPTEFGWPVWRFHGDARFTFAQQNSLEQQAQFTVRAYQMGKEWGWVGTMFLWNLDYNVTAGATELANFGIVGSPTYNALSAMPK